MDFNLTLCSIFFVLMFFVVPIACYLLCQKETLIRLRKLLFALYFIVLLIGITANISFDGNILKVDYVFVSEWGNKNMYWGFENISALNIVFNILMLIPVGAFIASDLKERKPVFTILLSCLIGLIVSLGIETVQYILPVDRVVEFSDTLFNTISAGLGAGMILIFAKLRPKVQKALAKEENKKDGE